MGALGASVRSCASQGDSSRRHGNNTPALNVVKHLPPLFKYMPLAGASKEVWERRRDC